MGRADPIATAVQDANERRHAYLLAVFSVDQKIEAEMRQIPHRSFEPRHLAPLVKLGADALAICRDCYHAAARFGRFSSGYLSLFDLEQLP